MEHLVTIIIPTFNQARYIEQSVSSALSQSYLNLEVIVVDDGSTDDTMAILAGFADERVQVVTQKNSGPSAAINHGLRLARGEFLALLGADDVAEPPRIENQVAIMTTTQNAAVFCKPSIIDANGNIRLDSDHVRVFDSLPKGNTAADHIRTLFYHGNYLCAPSLCLRRSTVEHVGLFHEGLVQLQDMEYWIRMFGLGLTCAVQEHRFVRYRRHGENLSGTARKLACDREHCFVLQHFFEHVEPRVARAAFAKVLDPNSADMPLCPDERGMVYLSHSRENVRELAYADLIAVRQRAAVPPERHLLDFAEYFGVLNENLG